MGMLATEDCLVFLKRLPNNSIDSLVTDPPAGISFMDKSWDSNKGGRREWVGWMTDVMAECLRVLKPGGHALVWSLPRTSHWTATALEDAGWEVRDCVTHLFGSGFPKSLNLNDEWGGWGTALKPAAEFWWLARKPLAERTVEHNVARWRTGAINIDGCRNDAPVAAQALPALNSPTGMVYKFQTGTGRSGVMSEPQTGRWPANLVLDEEAAEQLDAQVAFSRSSYRAPAARQRNNGIGLGSTDTRSGISKAPDNYGDGGGPSRFFYVAKASRKERNAGTSERNDHPTVKSLALMRWLCRMITPPEGTVLDPFAGSGSTLIAAQLEGFGWIGCESSPEYVAIAEARLGSIE